MSAPLVVTTTDGTCWTRRTVTAGGIALYAPERVQTCPEFVMATLDELAGHGISRVADVLPAPVGPKPQAPWQIALTEEEIEQLAAAGNRTVNDLVHDDLCACDAWPETCLSSGGYFQGYWDWAYLETAVPAVIGLWESMRSGANEEPLPAGPEREPASYPPALPWAQLMDDEDLTEALGEVWTAVRPIAEGTEADARQVLAELEGVLGSCRALAETQHAHNTSPGPDARQRATQAPYASRPLPPRDAVCARPGCGHPGVEHHHADTKCWVRLSKPLGAPVTVCGCSGFVAGAGEQS